MPVYQLPAKDTNSSNALYKKLTDIEFNDTLNPLNNTLATIFTNLGIDFNTTTVAEAYNLISAKENSFNVSLYQANVNQIILTSNITFQHLPYLRYLNKQIICFKAIANNTASVTISIDGLPYRDIKQNNTDLLADYIKQDEYIFLIYNGTNFELLSHPVATQQQAYQGIDNNSMMTPYLVNSVVPKPGKQIILSNNILDANDNIDFSAGNFIFSDYSGSANLSAITKKLNANWVVATNEGGLDTGSKANSTWYYCYAIYNPTTSISDVIFSANALSPTLPSGFTKYKYIGAIKTNSVGNIISFLQIDNYFNFKDFIFEFNGPAPTTKTLLTLSGIPSGRCTKVLLSFYQNTAIAVRSIRAGHPDNNTLQLVCYGGVGHITFDLGASMEIFTNTNSQIAWFSGYASTTRIENSRYQDLDL